MSKLAPALLDIFTRVCALCPGALRRAFARAAARLAVLLRLRAAATTRTNLHRCFPQLTQPELDRLTLASLGETANLVLESGLIFHADQRRLDSLLESVSGLDDLQRTLASSRGVLLLVPHFGNWEYLALYLGRLKLVALYDPPANARVDARLKRARERTGTTMLPLDARGLRQAYRTLQGGGLLGVLPDQVPDRRSGLHVPFFGHRALTMTLVHRLIRRHDPAVFIGSATRHRGRFRIELSALEGEIGSAAAETSLTAMNRGIEALIGTAPAQYQWEYRRFKSPPAGTPKIY